MLHKILFVAGYSDVDLFINGQRQAGQPTVHFDPHPAWQAKLCEQLEAHFGSRAALNQYVQSMRDGTIEYQTIDYVARLVFAHHGIEDADHLAAVYINPIYTAQNGFHFLAVLQTYAGHHLEMPSWDAVRQGQSHSAA